MPRKTTLTVSDIKLIRKAVVERKRLRDEAMKLSNAALGIKFNVAPTTISAISNHYYSYQSAKHEETLASIE